jgi:hypothetical protein
MVAYFVHSVLREESLRLLVGDTGMHDHVITLLPVDRGRHTVLVTNLESCIARQDETHPYQACS